MREIVAADQPFVREEFPRGEALERFADQPYKREIIESLEEGEVPAGDTVTVYRNDGWSDLCLGPHVPSTGRLTAFKLMKVAGAYWRGDEGRPMLTRIYGTAWATQEDLDDYLHRLEEAEKRDHRRLGRELDLFSFPEELGPGLWVWHPKGGIFRKQLEDYVRDLHLERGYDLVVTPHIARSVLWETSGPPREVRGQHVPADADDDDRRLLRQADELPVPRARLQVEDALVPRPADAAVRARHHLPARTDRDAARPAADPRRAPRTTRTSSARHDQLVDEILGSSTSRSRSSGRSASPSP